MWTPRLGVHKVRLQVPKPRLGLPKPELVDPKAWVPQPELVDPKALGSTSFDSRFLSLGLGSQSLSL